jgi:hypothetical protein
MGEKWNACRILVEKPEGKRALGRPTRRWVENIKMVLRQDGMVWIAFNWLRMGISGRFL